MKKTLKISMSVLAPALLMMMIGVPTAAQHLISSKAGFVNRAEGKVYIIRSDSVDGEKGRASLGTQMREGDILSTEMGSFAEVLLNPGSYLRLDQKSEIRAVNTNLDQIRFEVIKGSANIEIGEIDKKIPIEIITPNGSLFAVKQGLHRIDINDGATIVSARQGELLLGARDLAMVNKGYKISRGKFARLTGAPNPALAKIDKDRIDSFDTWCFNRAATLMSANQMALRQSRTTSPLAYGWTYDPFNSCYTFIPRRGLFYSPYGFGFFSSYGNCFTCWGGWGYGYGYGYGYGSGSGNYGGGTNLPPRVVAGLDRAPVRREIEGRRIDTSGGSSGSSDAGFGGFSSRSVSSGSVSAPSAPSAISAPAPSRGDTSGGGRSMPTRP